MGACAKRYLRPVPKHLPHDALMGLADIFSDRVQTKYVAQALDDGGLSSAASTDENVQIWIEVHLRAIKKSPVPSQAKKFSVFFGCRVAVQADPRVRV